MKVISYCGYYPDRAHNEIAKRPEPYWNAYFYVWGAKVGSHRRDFWIQRESGNRINITKTNFATVRKTFGAWATRQIPTLAGDVAEPALIPVPSKDGVVGAATYRSLKMVEEAFAGTAYEHCVVDGLRWTEKLTQAHLGGSRSRARLLPFLTTNADVNDDNAILVDELYSTGGSLLACADHFEGGLRFRVRHAEHRR